MSHINPPYRTDPWQIIVNWSGGAPVQFVAIDFGNGNGYAYPDDSGNNYPGGFNVYASSDGIHWNIVARLGAIESTPSAFAISSTDTLFGYAVNNVFNDFVYLTFRGTTTIILGPNGGCPTPSLAGMATPTLHSFTTDPSLYPQLFHPIYQSSDPTLGDGSLVGYVEELVVGDASIGYSSYDPSPCLSGQPAYLVSGNGTYVIAGAATDASNNNIPLYWRSTDGATWTPFATPWTPPDNWYPWENDVWFDDGSQRTVSVPGQFDGTPTYLWFSSFVTGGTQVGSLYQSSDGCQTWQASSYMWGFNGSNETDDHYVGRGDVTSYGEIGNPSSSTGWTECYGEIDGHRIGVNIQGVNVYTGPAGTSPSSWTEVTLPMPPNATSYAAEGSAADFNEYTLTIEGYEQNISNLNTYDLPDYENQLAFWESVNGGNYPNAQLGPYDASGDIAIVNGEIANVNSKIAGYEEDIADTSPPTPREANAKPYYASYSKVGGGIFVVVGSSTQHINFNHITQENLNIPLIWWSKDGVTWNVATPGTTTVAALDIAPATSGTDTATAMANFNWTSTFYGIVSGVNAADQIFAMTPTP